MMFGVVLVALATVSVWLWGMHNPSAYYFVMTMGTMAIIAATIAIIVKIVQGEE